MSGKIFRIPAAALADVIMRELEETAMLDAREPFLGAASGAATHPTAADSPAAFDISGLDLSEACDWLRRRLAEGPRRADELIDLWAASDSAAPIARDLAAEILHAAADSLKLEWRTTGPAGLRVEWRLPAVEPKNGPAAAMPAAATTDRPRAAAYLTSPAAATASSPAACLCPACHVDRLAAIFRETEASGLIDTPLLRCSWQALRAGIVAQVDSKTYSSNPLAAN